MTYTLPAWADLPATTSALNTANLSLYNTAINDLDTRVAAAQTDMAVTAVKTSAYTAAAYDYVPVDTTSGNVTVTLPTAPADKVNVGVKQVVRGGVNTVTIAAGGSDHFNTAAGPTTDTLTLLGDGAVYQYVAATSVWVSQSDDSSLAQLDIRYKNVPVTLTFASTLATNAALGNYFRTTVTSAFTLGVPTNPTDGQVVTWEFLSTGGPWAITATTGFALGAFTSPATTASKRDFLTAVYNSVTSLWYVTQFAKGY
jgi:hypothetical protein